MTGLISRQQVEEHAPSAPIDSMPSPPARDRSAVLAWFPVPFARLQLPGWAICLVTALTISVLDVAVSRRAYAAAGSGDTARWFPGRGGPARASSEFWGQVFP